MFNTLEFVPNHKPAKEKDIKTCSTFLNTHNRVLVITGAGVSTESGIPDYRSEGVGSFARSSSRPVQFQDFVSKPEVRQRYWARNYVGWPRFSSIEPNYNHIFLKKLEELFIVSCVVTQNVDNLHFKAKSKNVIELHGSAYRVICLKCTYSVQRHLFQRKLKDLNGYIEVSPEIRPDGDTELPQRVESSFKVPPCPNCGGILKPDIVFFGDNVPKSKVEAVEKEVLACDSILVLGSSLSTLSGYRIILHAKRLAKPIAIINIGPTRADSSALLKINAKCSDILSRIQL